MWNDDPDSGMVAQPSCTAPHQTGNAVDVNPLGSTTYAQLQQVMYEAGWVRYESEAWHFECCGTKRYLAAQDAGVNVIG